MIFLRKRVYKTSNCSGITATTFDFLIASYKYGKTRTKFENSKTPAFSAHHSGPRFFNNWIGY